MSYIPLFIDAEAGGTILVVGGGEIAAAKIEALASVGASLEVVAKTVSEVAVTLCEKHDYRYRQAVYDASDLAGRRVVIAATDDAEVNQQIAADCRARNILVNVVDDPRRCDFIFPALVRRGPLQIAISTSGIAPVLARIIKQAIEALLPAQFEQVIAFMHTKKHIMRRKLTHIQPRRLFSEQIIRGPIAEELLEGNTDKAERLFDSALTAFPNTHKAALYLIGAGPGHPDLMTLKAIRLLGQADLVLYDRLTSPQLLEQYARKDAQKICVGKKRDHHHKTQEAIDGLIETHLRKGRIVVRLKGGDPGIYAHGAEEIAIAKRLSVPYQIVPGISAANGCAAYAGIPLTERDGAQSVRFLTLYQKHLHDAGFWEGLRYAKHDTLVVYMSSQHFGTLCSRLVEYGFSHDTPFLVIEQGTTPYQKNYPGTLGDFDAEYGEHNFASPCLMIIGDVVAWHTSHRWKQEPVHIGQYFASLPSQKEPAHV